MAAANGTAMPTRTNGVNATTNGHGSSYAAKHDLAAHFIGGNHLAAAAPSRVKDFVQSHDGHTVITNVRQLAANRELVLELTTVFRS